MSTLEEQARELLSAHNSSHSPTQIFLDDAIAAVAAALRSIQEPEGWKLVPIEPNWDMRNEGREFLVDGLEKEPEKLAYFLWKTMVAAAPQRSPAMHNREDHMVVLKRDPEGVPTTWCDPEIVDLVSALNTETVQTVASCSGHGHRPGFIALKDGRVLLVCSSLADARKTDHLWPDINGEASEREDENYHVIMTMGRLLAEIAVILKGPEPAGTAWSYHDLPQMVRELKEGTSAKS